MLLLLPQAALQGPWTSPSLQDTKSPNSRISPVAGGTVAVTNSQTGSSDPAFWGSLLPMRPDTLVLMLCTGDSSRFTSRDSLNTYRYSQDLLSKRNTELRYTLQTHRSDMGLEILYRFSFQCELKVQWLAWFLLFSFF